MFPTVLGILHTVYEVILKCDLNCVKCDFQKVMEISIMTLHFFLIISDAKNIYYLLFKLETSCAFIGHTKKDWTEKEN